MRTIKLEQIAFHGTATYVETQVRLYRKVKRIEALEDGLNQQYYQPLLQSMHDDPRWSAFRARTIGSEEALRKIDFKVELNPFRSVR